MSSVSPADTSNQVVQTIMAHPSSSEKEHPFWANLPGENDNSFKETRAFIEKGLFGSTATNVTFTRDEEGCWQSRYPNKHFHVTNDGHVFSFEVFYTPPHQDTFKKIKEGTERIDSISFPFHHRDDKAISSILLKLSTKSTRTDSHEPSVDGNYDKNNFYRMRTLRYIVSKMTITDLGVEKELPEGEYEVRAHVEVTLKLPKALQHPWNDQSLSLAEGKNLWLTNAVDKLNDMMLTDPEVMLTKKKGNFCTTETRTIALTDGAIDLEIHHRVIDDRRALDELTNGHQDITITFDTPTDLDRGHSGMTTIKDSLILLALGYSNEDSPKAGDPKRSIWVGSKVLPRISCRLGSNEMVEYTQEVLEGLEYAQDLKVTVRPWSDY